MNPRFRSLIALCVILIAAGIAWLNRQKQGPAHAPEPPRETALPWASAGEDRSLSGSESPLMETREAREKREALAEGERNRMTAMWLANISGAFARTSANLATDFNLSPEQAEKVNAIFARRRQELAALLARMTSGEAGDDKETFRKITALIRNKGLRSDLEGVLSAEQLQAFDEGEAKRQRETIEARAYRDMAEISEVANLKDSQKQSVLGILAKQASAKVEEEADSRAFMSLMYGGLAADMDPSIVAVIGDMVNIDPAGAPDLEYGSAEHEKWTEARKAERIENELTGLKNVLDEDQLTRYRDHLEAEPVR